VSDNSISDGIDQVVKVAQELSLGEAYAGHAESIVGNFLDANEW
jgi:hypothetical protein